MPQQAKIDISAGLVERPKIKTGSVDLSSGLQDVPAGSKFETTRGPSPEAIQAAELKRIRERKPIIGRSGSVLTTPLVSPETVESLLAVTPVARLNQAMLRSIGMEPTRGGIEKEVGKGTSPLKAGVMEFIHGMQKSGAGLAAGATSPAGAAMLHPVTRPFGAAILAAEGAETAGKGVGSIIDEPSRIRRPEVAEEVFGGTAQAVTPLIGMRGQVKGSARAIEQMPETMRAGVQYGLAIDRSLTGKALSERAQQMAAQEAAHKIQTFETILDNAKASAEAGAIQKAKVFENLLERAKTAVENQARWEAQQKIRAVKVAEQEAIQQTRVNTEQQLNTNSIVNRDAIRFKERQVKGELDSQYSAVRESVGERPLNAEPIVGAVEKASMDILKGSKENIKIFQEILEESGALELGQASVFRGAGQAGRRSFPGQVPIEGLDAATMQRIAQQVPEARTGITTRPSGLSFADAQGFVNELGRKMFSGSPIPGDVYRALKHVRDSIAKQLEVAAKDAGVLEQFKKVQADWHKYMRTFHDGRPLNGIPGVPDSAGSPLARILAAEDPIPARGPITGRASERAMQMMRDYGIDTALAKQILADTVLLKNLPTKAKQIPSIALADKPLPETPLPKQPSMKELPLKPETPPKVDPAALKLEAIEKLVEKLKTPTHWDALFASGAVWAAATGHPLVAVGALTHPIGKRVIATGLERMKGRLSKPTPEEIQAAREQP